MIAERFCTASIVWQQVQDKSNMNKCCPQNHAGAAILTTTKDEEKNLRASVASELT